MSSAIALVFAVPLSLGIALFTNELAPRRLRRPVIYVVDLLAAIPSVVYGLWALAVLEHPVETVYQHIADTIGKLPVLDRVFGGPTSGASFMTAGIVLAVMMIPIVTAISREVLATVSQDDKNAALAMGATRWEMLRVCVFPRARSGLVGAVMLGMGRALGETIAVALVIGSNQQITSHLFQPGDSMAVGDRARVRRGREHAALPRRADRPRRAAVRVHAPRQRVARWIANRADRRAAHDDRPPPPPPAPTPASCPTGSGNARPARAAAPRTLLATAWMVGSVVVALVPLGFIAVYVMAKGASVISWAFLTQNLPIITRAPGRRHLARDRRHLAPDRDRGRDGGPARRARRDLPQRVRRANDRPRG